ncbi:alpha/beta hydrolase [Curtobacterium sp. VKM Ac-1395]|uniref:alpha/beta hydrolase n=1 Tax=Curtobacterium sp. VKM Ac-1395 TaxID=2783815 RepID=UPI001889F6C0|nr:alpha/beta hydrolase [Curtobacterium sp. VKM Ac-1395]MBF4591614.1 hypothetical protein [Curtobacterium sp. VKM Ac-1395]
MAMQLTERSRSIAAGASATTRASALAVGWQGASRQRFTSTASTLPDAANRVCSRVDAAATALETYAEQVRQIQDEAQRIRSAQDNAAADVARNANSTARAAHAAHADDASDADRAALRRLQSSSDDLALTQARLATQWTELVARRQAADRAAASALSGSDVVGNTISFAASMPSMSDADFLVALTTMPPEQLAALQKQIEMRLASMEPDVVKQWWDSMGGRGSAGEHSAAQDGLITALPAVIGNLNGVAYWARDQANRISAEKAFDAAKADLKRAKESVAGAVGRTAYSRALAKLRAAEQQHDALENFLAGARTPLNLRTPLPRQMVSFKPGAPPLGAFSVGDLDTAGSVSYLVPGMGSSLEDTTHYMRTGSNIQAAQQRLPPPAEPTAVVTWLGYEAPPDFTKTGDPAVFNQEYAERGAPALEQDLSGLRATRPDASLNVLAHSYGSTVASLALADSADVDVNSFVTYGSAGMHTSVPDASATHVRHMYAAQADEKYGVAWVGRTFSSPHRADPTEGFGSTPIGTGGASAVNVHDLSANGQGDDFGYLDSGTQSLAATAKVTLP